VASRRSAGPAAAPQVRKVRKAEAVWRISLDPDLGQKLETMAAARGTTVETLIRLGVQNLTLRGGVMCLSDVMQFGKYHGEAVENVIPCDPRYIRWCLKAIDRFSLTEDAIDLLYQVEHSDEREHRDELDTL
jgi:hypothetical protein